MRPVITISNLAKRFGSLTAVDDLSLSIYSGEIFGLLGPNGAGKTTTLNLISGLLPPTSGEILIRELDPWLKARATRTLLGFVPQETALYEDLNAYENLQYYYALYGRDLPGMRKAVNATLELMGLRDRAGDHVRTYSGGMKRRLALGRALLHDPEILFLDEPTLGVDVHTTHVLWNHIRQLKKRGKTVIVTTNYMSEADFLCDRLAIIDHGRLIALDTPANLKATIGIDRVQVEISQSDGHVNETITALHRSDGSIEARVEEGRLPSLRRLELRTPHSAEKLPSILTIIARHCTVHSIEMQRPSLDDVFLNYTGRKLRD